MFMKYFQANREWHDVRLRTGGFRIVVALGDPAARGIAVWLEESDWRC
jgi:hypothetical protein